MEPIKFLDVLLEPEREKDCLVIKKPINADGESKGVEFAQIVGDIEKLYTVFCGEGRAYNLELKSLVLPNEKAKEITEGSILRLKKICLIPYPDTRPDFGIWLEIKTEENRRPDELINALPIPAGIEEIYIKIWNTNNKKILREMESL